MNKILKISNKWLLDINELRLLWCTSKSWESTIGKFGTWLKYALSVLIRNDIDFNIYLWKQKVNIQTESIKIRDKDFERVIIDFETTSITTNLWVEWTVWQGLREFIANWLDEWWDYEIVDEFFLYDNITTVTFDYSQIEEYMDDFDFWDWIEVEDWYFYKKSKWWEYSKVFKEWFLVYEANGWWEFDYRIDSLKINESRMAEDRWEVWRWIAKIQQLMNKEDVEKIVELWEYSIANHSSSDKLWEWWNDIKSEDFTPYDGYDLKATVRKFEKENLWENRADLVFSGVVYVNHNNEIERWIFLQWEDFEEDWDYDVNTENIYIWLRYPESHYIDSYSNEYDYKPTIKYAKKYREADRLIKEKWFKNEIEVAMYFISREKDYMDWKSISMSSINSPIQWYTTNTGMYNAGSNWNNTSITNNSLAADIFGSK